VRDAALAGLIALLPVAAVAQSPCVVVEQGDSHKLEIGVDRDGAFVRLTDQRRVPMGPVPVRVYAGKRMGAAAQERFSQLTSVAGQQMAYRTRPEGGFVVSSAQQPDLLLAIVADAKDEFLVIETMDGRLQDYVAIYQFDRAKARRLLDCARR
jgi:hypothetical protein